MVYHVLCCHDIATLCKVMLSHGRVILCCLRLCHVVLCRIRRDALLSSYGLFCNDVFWYDLFCQGVCHVMIGSVMLWYVLSFSVLSCSALVRSVTLCYAIVCHGIAILCSVIFCHARGLFCHAMLCHDVFCSVCRSLCCFLLRHVAIMSCPSRCSAGVLWYVL